MPALFLFSTNIHSVETFLKNFYKDKPLPNVSIFENYNCLSENNLDLDCFVNDYKHSNNSKYRVKSWIPNLVEGSYLHLTEFFVFCLVGVAKCYAARSFALGPLHPKPVPPCHYRSPCNFRQLGFELQSDILVCC